MIICPGSGVLRDWTAGKVRCRSCSRWLWAQTIGANLGWTPPHTKE